jgi:hypothetical protein
MANSSCPQAQGGSLTDSPNAITTATVIQYLTGSGYSPTGCFPTTGFCPPPIAVSSPMPDPLASMVAPVFCEIGCPVEKSLDSGGLTATNPSVASFGAGTTIRPGVYYGGIKITGSGTVTFSPGIYVLAGGGIDFGGTATTNGDGVMIYNTSDPQKPTGAGACASIKMDGGGSTNFTPPTSGPYKDVVFWQDPACTPYRCTGLACNDFKIGGGGSAASGVYYLPGATFSETGSKTLGSAQIIADQFSFGGNAKFSITSGNYVSLPLLSLLKLVE